MHQIGLLLGTGFISSIAMLAQTQPNGMPLQRPERGRPYSATVTSTSLQTFPDGMHLTQTTTILEYRDAEGRTRTEATERVSCSSELTKVITIRDPTTDASYRLDPVRKYALRLHIATPVTISMADLQSAQGARGDGRTQPTNSDAIARLAVQRQRLQSELAALGDQMRTTRERKDPNNNVEDLGSQAVNGVPARGTRVTTIVPVGAIGNDREFRSVTERWFSPELNLLVKSVTTDPRFGTTTYELTKITREPPDPSLFRVPSDYTIAGVPR
jgi:hypothetical protein